jgi:hypothetical protein
VPTNFNRPLLESDSATMSQIDRWLPAGMSSYQGFRAVIQDE